jgi:hypothetical protein
MTSHIQQAAIILIVTLLLGVGMGAGFMKAITGRKEGFQNATGACNICGRVRPCGCRGIGTSTGGFTLGSTVGNCPPVPDMSKYVLKSTVPPCPQCPDMSEYMLKSECPPVPDLSKYILKSSIPKPQPIIIDSSSCKKECGECPPCPRPRCPDVKCPPPTKCPPPAPCPRPVCPPTQVKCKAEEAPSSGVRPYLAPLSVAGYGMA